MARYNESAVNAAITAARRTSRVSGREASAIHRVLRGRSGLAANLPETPVDPRDVKLGRLDKHERRAWQAGKTAYESDVKLADNPFNRTERTRLWAAWGQAWWDAEGDCYYRRNPESSDPWRHR